MNFSNNEHSSNPLAINFGKVLPFFILYRLISSDRSVKFIIYELHRMNNCLKSNKHNCNDKIGTCSFSRCSRSFLLLFCEFLSFTFKWMNDTVKLEPGLRMKSVVFSILSFWAFNHSENIMDSSKTHNAWSISRDWPLQ